MADTYYAWTPIRYGAERDKDNNLIGVKEIAAGQKVTKADLGVSDDEWQLLIDGGSVRTAKFPDDLRAGESPRSRNIRFARELMNEAVEGATNEAFLASQGEEVPTTTEGT